MFALDWLSTSWFILLFSPIITGWGVDNGVEYWVCGSAKKMGWCNEKFFVLLRLDLPSFPCTIVGPQQLGPAMGRAGEVTPASEDFYGDHSASPCFFFLFPPGNPCRASSASSPPSTKMALAISTICASRPTALGACPSKLCSCAFRLSLYLLCSTVFSAFYPTDETRFHAATHSKTLFPFQRSMSPAFLFRLSSSTTSALVQYTILF